MIAPILVIGGLLHLADAQFPPKPEGRTIIKSKFHENVTISFKEVCSPVYLSWRPLSYPN
jgi:hypothetical protein